VVQNDGSLGVSIEFLLWPQRGRVAFHTSVVGLGRNLISLVELEAKAPRPPSLEVRAPGLWTDIGIQTPLDHVTVDIEAFAVELDDPDDVFRGAFGTRTPVGSELEWETASTPVSGLSGHSYEIPCTVHGELLVGDDVIEIDGWGWRSHRWGVPSRSDRMRFRGRSSNGSWLRDTSDERELTMQVVGAAPVPDPTVDGQLQQYLCRNDAGDLAWIRRVDPPDTSP